MNSKISIELIFHRALENDVECETSTSPKALDIGLQPLIEKERIIAGFPFRAWDKKVTDERNKARQLVDEFNALKKDNVKGK